MSSETHSSSVPHNKFHESNAGDGTTVYDQYLHGVPLYLCLASCFITIFLVGLDQTIVITILETVGVKFDAYNNIGWVASGYMLTMAIFAATWGKVSIVFGRKWSILVALLLFEAGSLMCALAPTMNVLIGGRILAGVGGGGIQTLTFIISTELVPINKRPITFMILGIAFSVSSVCGPLLGGAFTEHVSWRWCFYINLPLGGLAACSLAIFFNPPSPKGTLKEKLLSFDYFGTFLFTAGIVLFLLALTFGGVQFPWKSAAVILCFILGGLLLIAFSVWNFKFSKNPLIPLHIIIVPQVDFPVLALFTTFFCFMGVAVYISTYFQVIHGASAIQTGLHLLPLILGVVVSSILSGVLMRKTNLIKPYAIAGGLLGAVGLGTLTLLDVHSSNANKIGLLILPGLSIGSLLQTGLMSAQVSAPKIDGSTILTTALFNFSRALGGAIGSDLSQTIFNSSFKDKVLKAVKESPSVFSDFDTSQLSKLMASPSLIKDLDEDARAIILECIMKSIKNVFYTSLAVGCLTCVFTVLYSNKRIPEEEQIQTKEEYEETKQEKTEAEYDQRESAN